MEMAFLNHYAETGDEVTAARLAGYSNPEQAGPTLLRKPRLSRAIRVLNRGMSEAIVAKGQRLTARWLTAAEKHLEATGDFNSVDIKAVSRAVKVAAEVAREQETAHNERDHLLETSIDALEAIADKLGIDISSITGRKLINGKAEKL